MSNTLSLDLLHKGLSKLSGLGMVEEEIVIEGTHILLRTLSANEHKAVNIYVAAYMKALEDQGELEDTHATLEFFTVRKIEPLSYAIIGLGDIDLRDTDFIEVEGGKLEKHVWLREFLGSMDLAIVDALHKKYIDLLKISEERAVSKIRFRDPEDELSTLEQRIDSLRRDLGKTLDTESTEVSTQKQSVRDVIFSTTPNEDEGPEGVEEEPSVEKFIRLDNPEKPYSEEEVEALEEQERLYAARANTISSKIQKARQPLNQVMPQVYEDGTPLALTPKRDEDPNYPILNQKQEVQRLANLDQKPDGGKNPNFRK